MKHGHGKYIWNDGSMYEGMWFENKINGRGIYIWPDGSSIKPKSHHKEVDPKLCVGCQFYLEVRSGHPSNFGCELLGVPCFLAPCSILEPEFSEWTMHSIVDMDSNNIADFFGFEYACVPLAAVGPICSVVFTYDSKHVAGNIKGETKPKHNTSSFPG